MGLIIGAKVVIGGKKKSGDSPAPPEPDMTIVDFSDMVISFSDVVIGYNND